MAKSNGNKLTDNQVKFCEEYLIHGNGTLAYKTAYKSVKRDSSAAVNASKALRNTNILAYLAKRKAEIAELLEITPEKVLKSYAERAFFDPRKLVDIETGYIIPLHRLPEHIASSVTKMKAKQIRPLKRKDEKTGETEVLEQTIIEIEWDKGDSSRDALAKFLGMFGADNAQRRMSALNDILSILPDQVQEELREKAKKMIEGEE